MAQVNSKTDVKIPVAIQFCFDDVGWYDGRDLRYKAQASRSGLPRYHALEDYAMLHEFGKAIGQKILTPLCLADWDKDNLLRGQVGITHDPYGWDRASTIDLDYFEKARDILDKSDFIEPAIHGLLHGVYSEDGKLLHETEYFKITNVDGKEMISLNSSEDFNNRIRLFFEIYNGWGFTKKIRSFVSPCGFANASKDMIADLAERLKALGVKYWANLGFCFEGPMEVLSDVAIMKKGGSYGKEGKTPPWDAYAIDPDVMLPFVSERNYGETNIIGMHWTNLLQFNPKKNLAFLPAWVDYINREREVFGTMIAKDIAESANQQLYHLYSEVDISDGRCFINVAEACKRKNSPDQNSFYISFAKGITPLTCTGGSIALFEEHKDFNTYLVAHNDTRVTISFK